MAKTTRKKTTPAAGTKTKKKVAAPVDADSAAPFDEDQIEEAAGEDATGDDEGGSGGGGSGKHLVIVESPTKAKTINKYLGKDYVVRASVGHVRDLPSRAPKGTKQLVPGVDLEHDFKPSYEIMPDKKKTIAELRKLAKSASDVWFATDLDREGEAIAWHLAQALNVKPAVAKRVVFNAITKSEIQNAFLHPRPIDENKVNAQQARRILDRIVGYQVSPLLWKKVAGGLSAGRVQSVATRLVVERERAIDAFTPEEFWKVTGYFATDLAKTPELAKAWREFLDRSGASAVAEDATDENDTSDSAQAAAPRTLKDKIAWLNERQCLRAELVEISGKTFEARDRDSALKIAQGLGFKLDKALETAAPKAKGPAKNLIVYQGSIAAAPQFAIKSIQTKRVTARPYAPFITSTLQQAAANRFSFPLQRTMRIAQQLYEGIDLKGAGGPTGLITYMRTDSTHLSGEALSMARSYIGSTFGEKYLPEKPNFFSSSNKAAQEAHEAIRPTDATLTPDRVRHALTDEQFKLYRLIWERFVGCQMASAEWDSTTVLIEAKTPASPLFRTSGRTLVFDGFYKVTGVPGGGDEAILPPLREQQPLAPLQIDPLQTFTSPPARFTEASLQKELEKEGIGRPSTYAAIIQTIQDRKYVQPLNARDRRLFATDLGKVVTDKLIQGFPQMMEVGYTRQMETELDKIEDENKDWIAMLHEFYTPFKVSLVSAQENMTHAKAELEPAPHKCPKCGSATVYRFGKNGRFLSCSTYPDCDFAAPIDREGNPLVPELSDIACPICNSGMTRRVGKFGPFLGCVNYPTCKGIVRLDPKKGVIVLPKPPALLIDLPCPKCGSQLALRSGKRGPWMSCSKYPKCRGRFGWSAIEPDKQAALEKQLAAHEAAHPQPQIKTVEGKVVDGTYIPKIVSADGEAATPEEVAVEA